MQGLRKELNGVAFQSPYGEYSFASVPSEGMVSREDLFLDLLSIVADSADVKKMILVSFNEEYGKKVTDALNEVQGKEIINGICWLFLSCRHWESEPMNYSHSYPFISVINR